METFITSANRGSVSTGPYQIDNSLKFEADNSEKLSRSQTTGTNRKKFTVSFWVKRTEIGAFQVLAIAEGSGNDISFLDFESDDFLRFRDTASASNQCILETNRKFRDPSAWYHIVLRVDTTDSTADDRTRIYVNGVQETSFSARTNFDQNDDTFWGYNGGALTWGNALNEANYFSGYVADAYYIDGQSLAPTEFGEFDEDSGIWIPINASGLSVGNNGYYLDFKDSSNLGNDKSGGTDLSEVNIAAADQATDTPTNNFATLNPLFKYPGSQVISEGATLVTRTSGSGLNKTFYTTQGVTSGKWYIEAQLSGSHGMIGATTMTSMSSYAPDGTYTGTQSTDIGYYSYNGQYYIGASGTSWGAGNWNTTSYIVQIAIDMDNRKIYFGNNNTYQASGNPAGNSNGITLPDTSDGYMLAFSYDGSGVWKLNTGGYTTISISSAASDANGYGTFEYAPPSGY